MTSFSPSQVIACPHCRQLALRRRLRTFNSYGVTRWSDGYISCFPGLPAFTRCSACKGVFWLEDAAVVGELPDSRREPPRGLWRRFQYRLRGIKTHSDRQTIPDDWMWAEPVEHPDVDAFIIGIENFSEDEPLEREQKLRRLLWWRFNAHHRIAGRASTEISTTIRNAHERQNLLRLLDLSRIGDTTPKIERAEILRELGRFDEAREALLSLDQGTADVALLMAKIAARDTTVFITSQESW